MSAPDTLSIVIPVFNEEACLPELIERCVSAAGKTSCPFEIILIDDGSSDRSPAMLRDAASQHPDQIVSIFLNRNYGQHAAVLAGLARARGSIVVTLDADLQNPPEEIPRLVETVQDGYDVVGTVRVPRQDSTFRRVGSWVVNRFAQKATGVMMNDYGCMLRAYRRSVIDSVLECHERSTFIPILANSFAGATTEIEVQHEKRSAGESKYGLWKLINLQFDLLTSMTTFPLRLLSVIGTMICLFGFAFAAFLLLARLIYGAEWAVEGVFTLFAVLFVFVGAQFIGMGLLGEYLGRIYYDVRARPRYSIRQVCGNGGLAPLNGDNASQDVNPEERTHRL